MRNKANIKYKRMFDNKTNIHGQSCTLVKHKEGNRCPCYNGETGYGDRYWHISNPDEPECDDNCYLAAEEVREDLYAFIFPADSIGDKALREIVLAAIGEIKKDDYVYVGKSDTDIFNLSKETDYLIYNNQKWRVLNPDLYKLGDIELAYVALLELIEAGERYEYSYSRFRCAS